MNLESRSAKTPCGDNGQRQKKCLLLLAVYTVLRAEKEKERAFGALQVASVRD